MSQVLTAISSSIDNLGIKQERKSELTSKLHQRIYCQNQVPLTQTLSTQEETAQGIRHE